MVRRRKQEEHLNHEAWAIPYGDLVTLLLAFFVVMYAMSSINEGKYRILSDSLVAAFRGAPRTLQPVQVGEKQVGSGADIQVTLVQQAMLEGQPRQMLEPMPIQVSDVARVHHASTPRRAQDSQGMSPVQPVVRVLEAVANEVEGAMADLIREELIIVRHRGLWVEVEIRTDILFESGKADLSEASAAILRRLAATLRPFPNPIRVEGHTDNVPIKTRQFPSNWELSAARAATVVHLLMQEGIEPERLAVIGLGEYRPAQSNATPEGRNANRRVLLVILGVDQPPEGGIADALTTAGPPALPPAEREPEPGFAVPPPEASLTAR